MTRFSTSYTQAFQKFYRTYCLFFLLICLLKNLSATPLSESTTEHQDLMFQNSSTTMTENATGNDWYVIKGVVYEIDVLTNGDNISNGTSSSYEEGNSFYDSLQTQNNLLELNNTSVPYYDVPLNSQENTTESGS